MFDEVLQHEELWGLVRSSCIENGIGAAFDARLIDSEGAASSDNVLILKVDEYYSTVRFATPPPCADFLVYVRCADGRYDLYIIESKNVSRTRYVRSKEIVEKFKTVLEDFLLVRFADVLLPPEVEIKQVRLYLVTNPLRANTTEEYRQYMKGTTLDAYAQLPPLQFLGRALVIEPILPNPAIAPC